MSTNNAPTPPHSQRSDTRPSSLAAEIGEELARARAARGLSVVDVTDRLLLSSRQVEALERGEVDAFHNYSFYMSALRRYGVFAEIDPERVAKLELSAPASSPRTFTPRTAAKPPARSHARDLAIVAGCVAALVVGGVLWLSRSQPIAPPAQQADGPPPIPTILFSQQPPPPAPETPPSSPVAAGTSDPSSAVTTPATRPAAAAAQRAGSHAEPSAAPASRAAKKVPAIEQSAAGQSAARAGSTPAIRRRPAATPVAEAPKPPAYGAYGALRLNEATWVLVRDGRNAVYGRSLPADAEVALDSRPTYLAIGSSNAELFVGARKVDTAKFVVNGQIQMRSSDFDGLPPATTASPGSAAAPRP